MIRLKYGNHKLGDDIAIFNMGTAKDCPSRKLGLCKVINKGLDCYAEKAERQYPKTVPAYREYQKLYWETHGAREILQDISRKVKGRRKPTRFFRFNESGDFGSQDDVDKLSTIAEGLKCFGITTYGYTARSDLDVSNAKFLAKGSGYDPKNNGTCIVISKEEPVPEGYIECPGEAKSCSKCNLCKIDVPHNIAFRQH